MKLALLGADVESLQLAEAAAAAGHEIAWQADTAAGMAGQWEGPHGAGGDWRQLLDAETTDAVIVGHGAGGDELRAHQVQELVRLDRPVLTTFPLFGSVLTYFEIDMARTESGAIVQHFNPLAEAAELSDAAEWIERGHPELGAIEQVNGTRRLDDRSRELVLWHFARDVEMLGKVAGRLDRVGAHAGAEGQEPNYAALSVQLLGPSGVPVRWSVEPPAGREGLTLTFVFQRGRLSFDFDASGRWESAPPDAKAAAKVVERFAATVEAGDSWASTWPDALHAMELTDSIEISLRRGRMIDVHHQQLTEHLAFKGTMAAAGCAMLFLLVPLYFFVAWIAGRFGVPIGQFAPHVLFGVLALFLAMQLLPKLVCRSPAEASEE
ncbi:MAG TPA: hypothetical protein VF175_01585 [Lacipirellula sp.]